MRFSFSHLAASSVLAFSIATLALASACGGDEACTRSFDPNVEDQACTEDLPVCVTTTLNGQPLLQAEYECTICETNFAEGGYRACPQARPTCNSGHCG